MLKYSNDKNKLIEDYIDLYYIDEKENNNLKIEFEKLKKRKTENQKIITTLMRK